MSMHRFDGLDITQMGISAGAQSNTLKTSRRASWEPGVQKSPDKMIIRALDNKILIFYANSRRSTGTTLEIPFSTIVIP